MRATSGEGFKESLSGGDSQDNGPYTNIRAQDDTQRHDEEHSSFGKDDQLIDGNV